MQVWIANALFLAYDWVMMNLLAVFDSRICERRSTAYCGGAESLVLGAILFVVQREIMVGSNES